MLDDLLGRGPPESAATNVVEPPLNKRTLLGVQCCIVATLGVLGALTPGGALLVAPLFVFGLYLVFASALTRDRTDVTSKFLLWAE